MSTAVVRSDSPDPQQTHVVDQALEQIQGMGAIPHKQGVGFRVWAPHAHAVSVIGEFNDWSENAHPLTHEVNGYWFADVREAKIGQHYKFRISNGDQPFDRIDPYAREVTNSVGEGVIHNPNFDWEGDTFHLPPHNEIVIYEMHVGTFNRSDKNVPGTFDDLIARLDHLEKLGVNVLELMPIAEFAGDLSWGYNPAHIFAVESAYGGPVAFKQFVKEAHARGFGIVLDVVYNHFGPSDLHLWQFDGWSENNKGGIYFYNDHRSTTPWGDTRPDYGRPEVRQFIYDNARMWLEDYHVDGLRYDMTAYIRTVSGIGDDDIREGWELMQWINHDLCRDFPNCMIVAEDLQTNNWLTKPTDHAGAGFTTQWDAAFVHPIREAVQQVEDCHRDMWSVRDALCHRYNNNAFERVIYSESHDEVANGKARVPTEIDPENPESRHAQKRSVLAAALALTAPGIPMLFQGQELLEDEWFRDTKPLDWKRAKTFAGIRRLFRDLIHWRLGGEGKTQGLMGQHINVFHVNDAEKVIAFVRHDDTHKGDVLVVANFSNHTFHDYSIGVPCPGTWHLRLNSDWIGYSDEFDDIPVESIDAEEQPRDGLPATGQVNLGPYALLVFSR